MVLDGSDRIDRIDVSGGLGNLHVDRGDASVGLAAVTKGETVGQRCVMRSVEQQDEGPKV